VLLQPLREIRNSKIYIYIYIKEINHIYIYNVKKLYTFSKYPCEKKNMCVFLDIKSRIYIEKDAMAFKTEYFVHIEVSSE